MAFTPILPPSAKRPRSEAARSSGLLNALSDIYPLTTWLLVGGSLQALLSLITNSWYTAVPVLTLLVLKFLDTLAIHFNLKKNPYLQAAILHRTAPVIPDSDGTISTEAADEKIVVFILGFKVNHPSGLFAPYLKDIGDANSAMWKELGRTAPDSGYLGSSSWSSRDARGGVHLMTLSYFRSTDDLHRFAYGPTHRAIWDKWNKWNKAGKVDHLGINHEIFEVEKHKWEAVYLNFQPTQLGATSFLRKGDKMVGGVVDDQWVGSLMDASKGKLRTSAGRLGRDPNALESVYGADAQGY
ncbi:uncharacterized protein AB675_9799 [Cyphellophora attinorum]|uniref:Monooxygenase n=1 Tax=Cyphellophora attinorum TaxID=1664694 RepID=A0A0N0NPA3_9EURO|nr:uncharacterized protein AB675_9799 [Phialophora attinorum]KPI42521.1 hypothetical protein AB675_9799 [Phialophora attinorum]